MRKFVYIVIVILTLPLVSHGQEGDVTNEIKPFYSVYLNKKINYRWSVDIYSLAAMKSMSHDFWLAQFNLGAKYKINRFYTFGFGYGISLYKYSIWWDSHYPQKPNFLNTVTFHTISAEIRRNDNLGRSLRLSNRLIVQQYIPRFEKYQTRIQYNVKLSYRRGNLPIALKPFVQGALYFYLNGEPISYYDDNFNLVEVAPPNGFHRYRVRFGTSFRPVPKYKKLSIVLYFALNREFNFSWLGKDINVPNPPQNGVIYTSYQFNNYNILGAQVNYFF